MSDDAPKKRSWFQIHLSTAVVLMVVAGVLMWVNVTPKLVMSLNILRSTERDSIEGQLNAWFEYLLEALMN